MMNLSIGGKLGRDAELRDANGTAVINFSVAVDGYDFKAREKKTTWVRVAVFGKRAEQLHQYLTKGTSVAVSGEMSLVSFQKRDGTTEAGVELKANDVTLLGGGSRREEEPSRGRAEPRREQRREEPRREQRRAEPKEESFDSGDPESGDYDGPDDDIPW